MKLVLLDCWTCSVHADPFHQRILPSLSGYQPAGAPELSDIGARVGGDSVDAQAFHSIWMLSRLAIRQHLSKCPPHVRPSAERRTPNAEIFSAK